MSAAFPVSIDGREYAANEQSIETADWITSLAGAHQRDVTFCCCCPAKPVRLVVKRYTAGTESVRYGLARWPETGLAHALTCRFFSEDDDDGVSVQPALEDLGDGKVRIHLADSLQRTAQKGKAAEYARSLPTAEKRAEPTVRRQDLATQDMLLRKLWRHAGLNVYRGASRAWYQMAFAVIQAAQRIVINRKGETLADYMFVFSAQGDKAVTAHNERVLNHVSSTGTRMYMLGRLKDYNRDKLQILLPTVDRGGAPKVLIATDMLDQAVGQSAFVRNVLDGAQDMVVALATVEPSGGEWWKALVISALTTSASGIPAASSAELEFEGHLRQQERSFLKPLALRVGHGEPMRPSYLLLDAPERTRWEIWGAHAECVVSELQRRVGEASAAGKAVLAWSANPRQPLPDLSCAGDD